MTSRAAKWAVSGLMDMIACRDLVGQPAGVRHRREHVVLAMPEQHRDLDVRQVESPRRAEGQRIVDPAVGGVAQRLGVVLRQQGADADVGHHPPVSGRHLRAERGDVTGRVGLDLGGGPHQARGQQLGLCSRRPCTRARWSRSSRRTSQDPRPPRAPATPARRPGSPARAAGPRRRARAVRRRNGRGPRTGPARARRRSPPRRAPRRRPVGRSAGRSRRSQAGRS